MRFRMAEAPRNVSDLVARAAETAPDHLAFAESTSDVAVSWSKLDKAVDAEARRLLDAGVQPGDRVAIQLPTGVPFVVALFGALRAGAAVVPVSAGPTAVAQPRMLGHLQTTHVVTY